MTLNTIIPMQTLRITTVFSILLGFVAACGPGKADTGEICELPQDATPGTETAVFTIRNDRDVAIYVTPYSTFGCNYGKVEIDVGGEPVLWAHSGTAVLSCTEDALCDWGCSEEGAMGLIINPGAVAQVEWTGSLWTEISLSLSEACNAELLCPVEPGFTCSVLELVEGEYTARVNLSEVCPVEDECAACTEGVCEVFFNGGIVSESFEATAVFPAGVEIVVD